MADVTISYKGSAIATMDSSGTKTLDTSGKYCEDDITVEYTKPSGGGTIIEDGNGDIELGKTGDVALITPLSVTANDTYTAPTNTGYSPVNVNVSGGGSVTVGVSFSASASFVQADVPSGSTYENGTAVVPSKSFFVIETTSSCNTLTTGSVSCHLLLYSRSPALRYIYIVDAGESGGTIRFHGSGGGD